MKTTKHALLSGVSGFFGAHQLEHLLENTDWHITGIASWQHKGTPERVEEVLKGNPEWKDRVTIITHDLNAPFTERTKQRIGEVDYIINVASDSHVDRSITDPVPFVQNNVNIALHMLEFAREVKPEKFIQFSTDEVYGPAPVGINHKEWSTILPSNPYSASKACQEAIAISYWRTYGVPVIITNTLNLFGEMQDAEKYIAKAIRCVESGDTLTVHGKEGDIGSRFYIHARNAGDAVLHIIENVKPVEYSDGGKIDRPERFNVVGFDELNNLEIAQLVAEIMGKELNYEFTDFHHTRPGHDRRYALDGMKLKEAGWQAPIPLTKSLKKYIDWTLKNPNWL
jgi:dTDP-glucose 4,6-dehydratase